MARSFRIASYNVLADSYVKPQWYPNVDPEVLRWDRRKFALAERVARLDTAYAWIVCGDLNAQSDSPVVKELVSSGFVDAYAGREQATCNPNRRAKRIDYIFHTSALRSEPAKLMEIDDLTPLPSADEPSDHLARVAAFEKKE